jgi:hypothetical protein
MIRTIVITFVAICTWSLALSGESGPQDIAYPDIAASINATLRAHLYDPAELDTAAYRRVEAEIQALAARADSDDAFIEGFRKIWQDGPFSHVELNKARQPAADLAAYLDTMRVGGGGAQLQWQGDTAILTVNTMMGLDTIEEIEAAYLEIANREPAALIIDLRENTGGAFAVRPLVAHLLSTPAVTGAFVAQKWNAQHQRRPTEADMLAVKPWEGWSITAFWADVQENLLTSIGFAPLEPVFTGPVYVLTSARTASAAELAADALSGTGRALLIGEKTAGKMLSQKIYDIPGGFHLSLPVADYYSISNGRIEGAGIRPAIETPAEESLSTALLQQGIDNH